MKEYSKIKVVLGRKMQKTVLSKGEGEGGRKMGSKKVIVISLMLAVMIAVSVFTTAILCIAAVASNNTQVSVEPPEKIEELQQWIYDQGYNFTVAENRVTRLSPEDRKALCGYKPLTAPTEPLPENVSFVLGMPKAGAKPPGQPPGGQPLPSAYDTMALGYVTPIKEQGACGSCWLHAAIADFESDVLINENQEFNFSEQEVGDCNIWSSVGGHNFCTGANSFLTTNYFTKYGAVDESCHPYAATPQTCLNCPILKNVDNWRIITVQFGDGESQITAIKNAILNYGPVYSTIYPHGPEFFAYDSGVYEYWGPEETDHAIEIIGWNDSLPHSHGTGAWMIKNSWGTDWGTSGPYPGCAWVAYGAANLGDDTTAIASYKNPGDVIFYHDECGWGGFGTGCGVPTAYGAVRFTPSWDTTLTAVDFWAVDTNMTYEIKIFDTLNTYPTYYTFSDQLGTTQTGTTNEMGYYSIQLDTPVELVSGNDFIVQGNLTLTATTHTDPIPIDYDDNSWLNWSSIATSSGESYKSCDGYGFVKYGTGGIDIGIRARVVAPPCGDICVNTTGWWRYGGDFNASDTPIPHAIDNATAGKTICVKDGTYTENVDVNKRLTIRSENGSANCIVNVSNPNDHVFDVTRNYVNISGFTVQNATAFGKAGIYLNGREHCSISNNMIPNNYYGIYVWSSGNNTLVNNNASANRYGIYLNYSSDNTLVNNNALNNTNYDFYSDQHSHNNSVKDLTVSSYPTTISFTYDNGVGIRGVETTPPDPSEKMNITKYVNATNVTADSWLFMNVSYEEADLGSVDEDSLRMWKHKGTWTEVPQPNGVNTVENYVYANITEFSIFAPLGNPSTCTCGDICVNTTGWWRDGGIFNASNTPIQHAVGNATAGDTICVKDGTYNENVDVNESHLTIQSDNGSAVTVVSAANSDDHVFEVTEDYVNISGFTVTGTTGLPKAGIYLGSNVEYCNISDNNASNNREGIWLWHSSNNIIANNNASNNDDHGIRLGFSGNNTLIGNNASNNTGMDIYDMGMGIDLYCSSNNTLTSNTMSGNKYSFDVYGASLSEYIQNIDPSNKVNGKPIYYLVNQQNQQIPVDAGFVGLISSTNIIMRDLILTDNLYGMRLLYTNNSRIENVTVSDNWLGIYLYYSNNNTLSNNTANSNNWDGIDLSYSSNNTLISNNASNNTGNGIDLSRSSNNTLTNNNANLNNDYDIELYSSSNNTLTNNTYGSTYLGYSSDDNVLTNNNASNSYCGIYMYRSSNNTLNSNTAYNSTYGIELRYSSDNVLTSNNASNNGNIGIYLKDSSDNVLTSNNASNNYRGIYMYCSSNNTLTNNTMSGNRYNFRVGGWDLSHYIQNIDPSNKVNEKPIYYLVNQQNQQIPVDAGFVGLINSTNIIVRDLILTNNSDGVLLFCSNNSRIENVTVSSNGDGICLYYSNNNTITDNTAPNNSHGIKLERSNNNTLTNNSANLNSWEGIKLERSNNNTLSNNNANFNRQEGIWLSYSSNNTLMNNTASYNYGYYYYYSKGIWLSRSSNNTLTNNTADSNRQHGICLWDSSNNTLMNNTASNNTDWDFYSNENSRNNTVEDLMIASYPTTVSFIYDNGVGLKGVDTAPGDPPGKVDISKYVNATNVTANSWLFLNVSYEEADMGSVDEDSLRMWKYNGTWTEVPPPNGVNTVEKYVYANITEFCIFAPLGTVPAVALPNITSFAPPSPVNDTVCNWRTFNVTVNQTVNVSWYLNDSFLFKNETVTEANCTLHAEVVGEHNVSAIASNPNGTDMQTWIWNVTLPTCNLSLTTGWNLISAPLNLTTWELGQESVVGDPLNVTPKNSLTSIYRYNTTSGLFEKCSHYEDWGWWPATGSESFTKLEPGKGYWVMAKNDCNLTFTGTEPSDLNITLNTSWNLVGWYSMQEALLGQESVVGDPWNVTPRNSLTSIYRYNSSTGLFEKCSHYEDWGWWSATGSEIFTKLEPGSGYWVMAKNDCVWRHET